MHVVQLQTDKYVMDKENIVLVYACCSALNPLYLMFLQGEKFWYMCFCTTPNRISDF